MFEYKITLIKFC